jgi:uncharacterized RDD family membrane protein YckC
MSAIVPMTQTIVPTPKTQAISYATFSRRFYADIIDGVVLRVIDVGVVAAIAGRAVAGAHSTLVAGAIAFVLWLAYNALGDGRGATLGKHLLKLRVVDADGQAPGMHRGLVRTLPQLGGCLVFVLAFKLAASGEPSTLLAGPPGGGLMLLLLLPALDGLWMLLDPHSQTLHDKLAGTYVVAAGRAR